MSQYPPPYGSYGTAGYPGPSTPLRPGSITVLAILAIVFGGLGTLCMGFGTIANGLQSSGALTLPWQPKFTPEIQRLNLGIAVVELALSIALLAIGIAALSLKPWARRAAASWWSIAMIVWAVIRCIVQIAWVGPATLDAAMQMQTQMQMYRPNPALNSQQMQSIMGASVVGGAVVMLLLQLVMPVLFLLLWRKPAVVTTFEDAARLRARGIDNS